MAELDDLKAAYEAAKAKEDALRKASSEVFRERQRAARAYFAADALAGGLAWREHARWGEFSGTRMSWVTEHIGVTEAEVSWSAWEACWNLLGGEDTFKRLHEPA